MPWGRSRGPPSFPLNRVSPSDVHTQNAGRSWGQDPATTDGGDAFQTFLADQLRTVEQTILKRYNQELAKAYEGIGKDTAFQDQIHMELDVPEEDGRQALLESDQSRRSQSQRKVSQQEALLASSAKNAALELSIAPHVLAGRPKTASPTNKDGGDCEAKLRRADTEISIGLHPVFLKRAPSWEDGTSSRIMNTLHSTSNPVEHRQSQTYYAGDEMTDDCSYYVRLLLGHPLKKTRLVYDMCTMVLLIYELLVIPMELSGLIGTQKLHDVLIASVWTADLFLSFFRGFVQYGVVELRLSYTAWAYIKSWFLLDFVLVLMDWILLCITPVVAFAGVPRGAKALRFWKFFRMFRFVRSYRVQRFLLSAHKSFSGTTQTAFQILTWIVGMLMLSHLIACFWYLLGTFFHDSPSWVWASRERYMQQYGEEPEKWYLYFTALHWAVTQFTPASMEVTPRSSFERVYNLFTILISLVMFPTFLTSITSNVAAWRKRNTDYIEGRRKLVDFLTENRISLELSIRIQSIVFTQYRNVKTAQRIHEPDIFLFNYLPPSLKEQLHAEIYQPKLIAHPFLKLLADGHGRTFIKICHKAMSQESLKPGEELFTYGKEAEKMHFVDCGSLLYCEGASPPQPHFDVHAGDWLCDQVLWMPWFYCGQMTAVQPCELASLDGAVFRHIVGERHSLHSLCSRFAARYMVVIKDEFCNDLGCPLEKIQNIISMEFKLDVPSNAD